MKYLHYGELYAISSSWFLTNVNEARNALKVKNKQVIDPNRNFPWQRTSTVWLNPYLCQMHCCAMTDKNKREIFLLCMKILVRSISFWSNCMFLAHVFIHFSLDKQIFFIYFKNFILLCFYINSFIISNYASHVA